MINLNMIKIQHSDTIIDILGKMKEKEGKDIILAIPFGHPVLHNYLSLKIIKNRAGNKELLIVTSDQTSRKIGKHLGIKYSFIKDDKAYEEENTKTKIMKHNFSFWEYLEFEIKHFFKDIKDTFTRNKTVQYYSIKYSKEQGKIGYFVFGLLVSLTVLLLIFYFAVTKTYITITPEINVKVRGKNFVFREMENQSESLSDNLIQIRKVSKVLYLEETFATTGVDEASISRSTGKVELYNKYFEEVTLKNNTRLQTSTGVILELTEGTTIPPAIDENGVLSPGTIEVKAVSQIRDMTGKIVGTGANIGKDEDMILPGLTSGQDMIYGKTTSEFRGAGEYNDDYVLSDIDIKNATGILEEKLKSSALKELQKQIKEENKSNNVTYEILGVSDIIQYSDFTSELLDSKKPGDKTRNFRLGGSIKVETYIYNKDSIVSKLKTVISDSIIEGSENILSINPDSLRASQIVGTSKNPFEVKVTMEIEALIIHNFLNENDAYVKRLKSIIMGLTKEEAEKILVNDSKISNVSIDITPFFVKKIANIPNNIIFEIEEN